MFSSDGDERNHDVTGGHQLLVALFLAISACGPGATPPASPHHEEEPPQETHPGEETPAEPQDADEDPGVSNKEKILGNRLKDAVAKKDWDLALHWIDEGANLDTVISTATILHIAVLEDHVKLLEHLLAKGADSNLLDSNGETALHWAARFNHVAPLV